MWQAVTFCLLVSQLTIAQSKSLVADALDWFAVWGAAKELRTVEQTCKGRFHGGQYEFLCIPMSVVISAGFDESRTCSISFMRITAYPGDGARRVGLGFQLPAGKSCGELPVNDGRFAVRVSPRSRSFDAVLSRRARDVALEFSRALPVNSCVLYFPWVKKGDPFVHVYKECASKLSEIWEFVIREGEVQSAPHWIYIEKEDSPATGAEWRLKRGELWFDKRRDIR